MDILSYNRRAWDRQVDLENEWTLPVSGEEVRKAREGEWGILLTPTIPVPRDWFPDLEGANVLCLASGGGQQGPILAAAGANVTVLDNSEKQLEQDRRVAGRDNLPLETVSGDMADLSMFESAAFDLIVHPVSNIFVPDVLPVWREAFRVLKPGCSLLAGLVNPVMFLFEWQELIGGGPSLRVRYRVPYSDMEQRDRSILERQQADGDPLEFGHTMDDLIGGQLKAGFVLTGFYEDRHAPHTGDRLSDHIATFFATRALKPGRDGHFFLPSGR